MVNGRIIAADSSVLAESLPVYVPQVNSKAKTLESANGRYRTKPTGFGNLPSRLIEGLVIIPNDWALVPVRKKRPYRHGWQTEPVINREKLKSFILEGDLQWSENNQKHWRAYPEGYGIRTGEWSGGKLAIDVDGGRAGLLLEEISGGDLPQTVSWTSGKIGRRQLLYQLSDSLRQRLKESGFTHHALERYGNLVCEGKEQLDFRYDRCQSVIPPSKHPETGAYSWIVPPTDSAVADAPQWLERLLFDYCNRKEQDEREAARKRTEAAQRIELLKQQGRSIDEITPLTLLEFINPNFLDWYEWRDCLLAAHHERLSELNVRQWSSSSTKHTDRGFDDVWKNIKGKSQKPCTAGKLRYIAKKQGWQPPRPEKRDLTEPAPVAYKAFCQQEAEQEQIGAIEAAIYQKQKKAAWEARVQAEQARLNSLRVEPTRVAEGRYIPSGTLSLPENPGIMLIDAPMGTGKTTALKEILEEHRSLYPEGLRALIVPRNTLGYQAAENLGLLHIADIGDEDGEFEGGMTDIVLCAESTHKIPIEALSNSPALVIFDEGEQQIKQLLKGGTTQGNPIPTICHLRELLQYVRSTGGNVVLSEDGITNLALDFLIDASGLELVEFFKFTRTEQAKREYKVYSSDTHVWDELEERLDNGENLLVASDSRDWICKIKKMLIDGKVISKEDILLIDRDSVKDEWVKEFRKEPDGFIQKRKPRVLLYSPTISSGISIADPNNHFSAVAFKFTHLEPREAKQMVERLRTDVPRFGFVSERGYKDDNYYSAFLPEQVLKDLKRNKDGSLRAANVINYLIESSKTSNSQGESLDIDEAMERIVAEKGDPNSILNFSLRHWSRFLARENYATSNLKEELLAIWRKTGYEVIDIKVPVIKSIKEKMIKTQEELLLEESERFAQIDTHGMLPPQAKDILNNPESDSAERLVAYKCLQENKLPGIDLNNPKTVYRWIYKDKGKELEQVEKQWFLLHPEAARMTDCWSFTAKFKIAMENGHAVWTPSLPMRASQSKLLNECPYLKQFVAGEISQYSSESPEVHKMDQWLVPHTPQLRRLFGLTFKHVDDPASKGRNKEAITNVSKILRDIGLQPEVLSKKGGKGNQIRIYTITNLEDDGREEILDALTRRFVCNCISKGDKEREVAQKIREDRSKAIISTLSHSKMVGDITVTNNTGWMDSPSGENSLSVVTQPVGGINNKHTCVTTNQPVLPRYYLNQFPLEWREEAQQLWEDADTEEARQILLDQWEKLLEQEEVA